MNKNQMSYKERKSFINNKNKAHKNENPEDKLKEQIHNEIKDIINLKMDTIKINLNNSNDSICLGNQLDTIDKQNLMNYDGENISIISNSNFDLYSDIENDSNSIEKDNEEKKVFIFQNSPIKRNLKSSYSNNNNQKSPVRNLKDYNLSRNLPIFDSNSTSNTYKIHNKNNISICKINKKIELFHMSEKKDINKNETELTNFFWEIDLPIEYAFKFIENGFDDLKILIEMTKSGIAISNQNLRNIGISKAGDRAKILIRLEEKAGIFPVDLEDKIVYNNNAKHNSLDNFLEKYNCKQYVNNFKRNGYYNIELLFCQMLIREPINRYILKNDLYITKEYDIKNILKGLEDGSKKYLEKLRKGNNNNKLEVDSNNKYSCNSCLVF